MNVALWTLPLLAALASAQDVAPPRTLAQLRMAMAERFQTAQRAPDRMEAMQKILVEFAAELAAFLQHEAKGDDRFNGRLQLVDTYMNLRDMDKAKSALAGLEVESAPPMALIAGAELATALGMDEQRRTWIDAAIAKPAPFEERVAVGMHLMTSLREIVKGEKIFTDAFAAAKDDEERARVRWYQAAAMREREDRADDDYYKAIEKLAAEFPATTWGGIARDHVAATKHEVGKPPVPLQLVSTDGKTVALADYLDKVLILDFTAAWSDRAPPAADFLLELHAEFANKGLALLTISVDDDTAQHAAFVRERKIPWPQVCDGKGWLTHAVLRYNIEMVPQVMVLDRKGNIAAMNLLTSDPVDQRRVREAVEKAIAAR